MNYYLINYGLILLGALITFIAQGFISISYSKYKKVKNNSKITGAEMARGILDRNGLTSVSVQEVSGNLTDHYDPNDAIVKIDSLSTFKTAISE